MKEEAILVSGGGCDSGICVWSDFNLRFRMDELIAKSVNLN